jgi:Pyruvate/2-oxoacid:ferredoxin oxidoreductase gamma subunit
MVLSLAGAMYSSQIRLAETSGVVRADHLPDRLPPSIKTPNILSALSELGTNTNSSKLMFLRWSVLLFDDGLETYRVGGMPLKVYSAARTLVDCVKFRE